MPSSSVTRWNSSGMTAPATANTPPSAAAHSTLLTTPLSLSHTHTHTSSHNAHTSLHTPLSLTSRPPQRTPPTAQHHRYVDVPHTVEKYSTGARVIVTEWVYGRHLDALNTAEGLRMTYMAVEACTASLVVTGKCCCSERSHSAPPKHCNATDPALPLTLLWCRLCCH